MRTPLAWSNLVHRKKRTAAAVAGIGIATVLVFVQLGFLHAVQSTATLIHDHLDFDLLLVSADYVTIYRPNSFPRSRLYDACSSADVATAVPVYVGFELWRNPAVPGTRRTIMILACRPTDPAFVMPEVRQNQEGLQEPDTVLFDRTSRPEFGPPAGPHGEAVQTELGHRRVTVVGEFTLGRSFGSDGVLVTSDRTYSRVLGGRPLDQVCLGLLKVRPGVSPEQAAARLRAALPEDVRVRSRSEVNAYERRYWVENTSTGIIFRFGVAVALVVGAVFAYQVISSDISNRLREYATLKAMGYTPAYLSRVVIQQALLLAVFGYVPALLVACGLYALIVLVAGIPTEMTLARAAGVFALTVGMCAASGLLALRRVKAADPADLF